MKVSKDDIELKTTLSQSERVDTAVDVLKQIALTAEPGTWEYERRVMYVSALLQYEIDREREMHTKDHLVAHT